MGIRYLTLVFADPEVGDFVERDEELATIETDKVCVFDFTSFLLTGGILNH